MTAVNKLKGWIKRQDTPTTKWLYKTLKQVRSASFPVIPGFHGALYTISRGIKGVFLNLVRVCWTTPLFQSQLERPCKQLYIFGGMPLVIGPLKMAFGDDVRLSGQTTFTGRSDAESTPELKVGSHIDIGWQCTFAVGTRIELQDNVRLSERCFLAGYPGHPLDPADRAAGLPATADQVGDIIVEEGAWLCFGTIVLAGVRIGAGSVVAAGSVVTKDIPPGVLAAGSPARVIRPIHADVEVAKSHAL
ncbi:acyltransferase [Pseudovibrio sp. SPO723]|uniref:acyltransferase n=1 Tax=Nesiotobacter zosterae TaxID=392721 RepID=UPI0029C33C89|nr:acyltransferase [Pseudovibrio sp. SPO723]MDX5595235.1 acyltransferase [Pseudovibrio sp. SPO723]